jgi:hypothetical protein
MSLLFEVTRWQERLIRMGEIICSETLILLLHRLYVSLTYPFRIIIQVGTMVKSSHTKVRRKRMVSKQIRQLKASPNSNLPL